MNVYDTIETIGNRAKSEIILAWYDYLDGVISDVALVQKFHIETGCIESVDSIGWYVNQWQGY